MQGEAEGLISRETPSLGSTVNTGDSKHVCLGELIQWGFSVLKSESKTLFA